jgi:hypothetical protein
MRSPATVLLFVLRERTVQLITRESTEQSFKNLLAMLVRTCTKVQLRAVGDHPEDIFNGRYETLCVQVRCEGESGEAVWVELREQSSSDVFFIWAADYGWDAYPQLSIARIEAATLLRYAAMVYRFMGDLNAANARGVLRTKDAYDPLPYEVGPDRGGWVRLLF